MILDVFQRAGRAVVLVLLGLAVPAVAGCSDDGEDGTAGDSGSTSTAGATSGASAGGGAAEVPCRTGTPTDGPALFTKLAGSYTFPGRKEACDFNGVTLVATAKYAVTLAAEPPIATITSAASSPLFSVTWDGKKDYACSSDIVESLELNDGTHVLRVAFLNGAPSSLALGTCTFILDQ